MANEKKGLVDITTGVEVTNANANGILDLTSGEVSQVANIGTTTIDAAQWGIVGALDQALASTDSPSFVTTTLTGNSALQVPSGTTGEQPGSPVNGMTRYNETTGKFEFYEGGAWVNFATVSGADHWDRVTGTPNYLIPDVVADDDGFVVVWHGFPSGETFPKIYAARVNTDGSVGLAAEIADGSNPRIAWNGNEYLQSHVFRCAFDYILRGIDIVGIKIFHFLFCDLFDLFLRYLAHFLFIGFSRSFGNSCRLLEQKRCGR